MASQHSCAYRSSEIFIESENIRRFSKEKDKPSVDNHLSLLEKEFDKMALACGMLELATEKESLKDIRISLGNDQFDKVEMQTRDFEKQVMLKLAKKANDDKDPLDLVPSRMLDSFR